MNAISEERSERKASDRLQISFLLILCVGKCSRAARLFSDLQEIFMDVLCGMGSSMVLIRASMLGNSLTKPSYLEESSPNLWKWLSHTPVPAAKFHQD